MPRELIVGYAAVAKCKTVIGKTFTLGEALAWFGILLLLLVLGAHYYRASNPVAVISLAGIILFHASGATWKKCVVAVTVSVT